MHKYRNFGLGLACQARGQCCYSKKSALAKIFTEINEQKCKVPPAITLQNRHVKITMYLGLDIKIEFTRNFDRCAISNLLNCLTKKIES